MKNKLICIATVPISLRLLLTDLVLHEMIMFLSKEKPEITYIQKGFKVE